VKHFFNLFLIISLSAPISADQAADKTSTGSSLKPFIYGAIAGAGICAATIFIRTKTKQYHVLRADLGALKNSFTSKANWSWPWTKHNAETNKKLAELQADFNRIQEASFKFTEQSAKDGLKLHKGFEKLEGKFEAQSSQILAFGKKIEKQRLNLESINDNLTNVNTTLDEHSKELIKHGNELVNTNSTLKAHSELLDALKEITSETGNDVKHIGSNVGRIDHNLGIISNAVRFYLEQEQNRSNTSGVSSWFKRGNPSLQDPQETKKLS